MFTFSRAFFVCLSLATTTLSASASTLPASCGTPEFLESGETLRRSSSFVGAADCYRVEVAKSGIWNFGLLHAEGSGVRYDVMDAAGRQPATLQRTVGENLAWMPAGTYYVRVESEDPGRPLSAYRLTARSLNSAWFVKSEENGELEIEEEGMTGGCWPWLAKSEENGELEIEEEGMTGGCWPWLAKSEENGELEIEEEGMTAGCWPWLAKSEENGELEIEEEGMTGGCWPWLAKSEENGELEIEEEGMTGGCWLPPAKRREILVAGLRRAFCSASIEDDHGDSLSCASKLSHRAEGELSNGWGDDIDTFRFRVTDWKPIELVATSDQPLAGELLDARGLRLQEIPGSDGQLRMARALAPGVYYLRVTGDAGSAYRLGLQRSAR